jgi:hypothetical protein
MRKLTPLSFAGTLRTHLVPAVQHELSQQFSNAASRSAPYSAKTCRQRWRRIQIKGDVNLTVETGDLAERLPWTNAELFSAGRGRYAHCSSSETQTGGNCDSQDSQTALPPVCLFSHMLPLNSTVVCLYTAHAALKRSCISARL